MKELFINGTGCISAQHTYNNASFLTDLKSYSTNRLFCVEPDYAAFFDAGALRRMSRVSKFALSAAFIAQQDSGVKIPGAISTGTGFGLLDNSGKFLKDVIGQNESVVSPTPFMQSTHNTVGGMIALMTGCHGHNFTFSQKGNSFESALTDARMLLEETDIDNFLVGGFDELTEYSLAIMERMNILKKEPCSNLKMYDENIAGVIAGEGAAFFVLSQTKGKGCYGKLIDNYAFTQPESGTEVLNNIKLFLKRNNMDLHEIGIVISGLCGDKVRDVLATDLMNNLFTSQTILTYKNLSGEYMTSSSFALWLGAKILRTGQLPNGAILIDREQKPENILIYNSYKNDHSLILIKSC